MMNAKYKIRDFAGWTIAIFGALALLLGLVGLLNPEFILSILGFEIIPRAERASTDYTIVFMIASSMASFNMGVYYVFAALNDLKIFYRWTVPFRTLTFLVFTTVVISGLAPLPFIGVGAWEFIGAAFTGYALYRHDKKEKGAS